MPPGKSMTPWQVASLGREERWVLVNCFMPGPDLLAFSLLQHLAPPGLLMKQLQSSHLERTPPFTTPMNQSQNGFENHCSIQMDRQPGVIE